MAIRQAVTLARTPNAALAAVGVYWGGLAAFVPDFKAGIGAPDAAFGFAMMMAATGSISAMGAAPWVMARLGRHGLTIAGLILAIASVYPLLPGGVVGFGLAMVAVGASVSLLDIGANMRLSVLEDRYHCHLMNFGHAMFSFSFAGAALVASLARSAGRGPDEVMPLFGGVIVLLSAVMWEGRGWTDAPPAADDADGRLSWRPVILAALILLASFITENASETWSALHIERTLGGPAGHGGLGPVALGLTMGVGRLMGQVAAQRFGEAALIMVSAVVGVVGALVLAFAPSVPVGVLGVGLIGVGVAVTVPSANSILGRAVRADQRGRAISRAWMIGFTGFFIGPAAMGTIAELWGLRVSFVAVALVLATVVPSVRALGRIAAQR